MSIQKCFSSLTAKKTVEESSTCVPSSDAKAVLAIFADEVRWLGGDEFEAYMHDEGRLESLLELRAHDLTREFHAVRSHVGGTFAARLRVDNGEEADVGFVIDEVQYLDIDDAAVGTSPSKCRYQSIAGGAYTLPVANAEKVTIRDYYEFDERNGLARLVDFRIVGFGDLTEEESHA